jgi:hypothetical protein
MVHASLGAPVREARHDTRASKRSPRKPSRARHRIGHVTQPDGGANEQLRALVRREPATDTCSRADEAHDIVSSPHQRAHGRAADGAGGTENEYAPRMR